MEGDRAAGDVGASHPEVGDSIRLLGTSSPIQDVSTVEESQVPVREPVQILDASQKVVVSLGVGAVQDPFLDPGQNPAMDHGGPRDPTLLTGKFIMHI